MNDVYYTEWPMLETNTTRCLCGYSTKISEKLTRKFYPQAVSQV